MTEVHQGSWPNTLGRREALRVIGLTIGGLLMGACESAARPASSPSTPASGPPDAARAASSPPTPASGAPDFSARFASFQPAPEPSLTDFSKVVWPDYVTRAGPEVKSLYEFQLQNGDLMRYMPCFCGCGASGHRNNRDCYVKQLNPDG